MLPHRQGNFLLDTDFALIEGTQKFLRVPPKEKTRSVIDHSDRAIRCEDLPDTTLNLFNRLQVGLVKQPLD